MKIDEKITWLVALVAIISMVAISTNLKGQQIHELRGSINTSGYNDVFPTISGDGNTMVFMNDYTDDGGFITMVSRKEAGGRWGLANEIDVLNPANLNAPGGFCLSFDGNTLVYSTRKGESVGGFDLWYMEYLGDGWSNPKNFGFPVSSAMDDSYPGFSPDGNWLYFTRCESIKSSGGGADCKIFRSERKRGRIKGWKTPEELDPIINSGNSILPRLLSDNMTMVFASDRSEGKGGYDWYFTRQDREGNWSNPTNMSFISTDSDDLFLSMYYRPDRAITSEINNRDKYDIVEIDIPEAFQPDKVVIKVGKVLDSNGDPVDADVRARNYENGESVTFTFPDIETGDYTLILPEGKVYDFSIVPKRSPEFYFSELLDYTSLRSSRKESADYILQIPGANAVLGLKTLQFIPQTTAVDPRSGMELDRLARLLGRNEKFNFEIASYQDSIITDSIPRPGLTEIITDTTFWDEFIYEYEYNYQYEIDEDSAKASFPQFTNFQLDSMLTIWNDSLSRTENDTLLADMFLASLIGVDTIEHVVDTIEHVDISYTYHNDLTQKRAEKLAEVLTERGIDPGRIIPIGYGDWRRPMTALKEEDLDNGFVEVIFKK